MSKTQQKGDDEKVEQEKLNEVLKEHRLWLQNKSDGKRADLSGADLSGADLSGANLREADLSGTNLKRADLDYSCLPLWCGSLDANFDDEQLYQIAYHLVRAGLHSKNASDETKDELSKLIDFANKFHRVNECGEIEREEMGK